MSTLAYALLTARREGAQPGTSTSSAPPGVGLWVDSVLAMFPAEALLAQAIVLALVERRGRDPLTGYPTEAMTSPRGALIAFGVITLCTLGLFMIAVAVASQGTYRAATSWLRMLIPSLAFIGWTVLVPGSLFDAIAPGLSDAWRISAVLGAAVVIAVAATWLAADASNSPADRSTAQ